MSVQSWVETLVANTADGPTLTAAAAATCLPAPAKITLPNNYFITPGRALRIIAQGRISCVVTTPGTARYDVRLGGTVVFDTGALNLNVVAKVNLPWWLDIVMMARTVGAGPPATVNFFGFGTFQSEAVVGSPLNTAGGNGSLLAPVGVPAVGSTVDPTTALSIDMFFTQTVATGSMTVHNYLVQALN